VTDGDGGAQPEGAAAEDYYNPIFEVLSGKNDPLVAAVAYSLYKQAKREWVLNFRATHGRRPSLSEHRVHAQTQTEQILSAYTAMASQVLAAYADAAIMGAAPRILKDAMRGGFMRSFWPSMAASAAFAAVLLLIVLVAALFGFGLPIQVNIPPRPG
jgi:hypothetical protein